MESDAKRLLQFLKSWLINTLAVLLAVQFVHGIHFRGDGILPPLLTALVLGIVNTFIRPILVLFALPLLIFSMGLFMLVINAFLLYFVGWLMRPAFQVDNLWAAFLGAIIISIVSLVLNIMTGGNRARISIQRHRQPPRSKKSDDDDDGNGPVIDV
jgi:putative membrane protein